GAAVERDALLDLRGARRVLDQEDVRLGMARSQDGHQLSPRAVATRLDLARERVELADRALQVLLADLVVGRGHPRPMIWPRVGLSLRVHQDLRRPRPPTRRRSRPVARRTRRSREARRAASGMALVCRNLSAWT